MQISPLIQIGPAPVPLTREEVLAHRQDTNIRQALKVAEIWRDQKINISTLAKPITGDLPQHIMYTISPDGHLQLKDQVPAPVPPTVLQILDYGPDITGTIKRRGRIRQHNYAALLPI